MIKTLPTYFLVLVMSVFMSSACLMAQNIIPDPGFEELEGPNDGMSTSLGHMTHWYNANGSPDHYNASPNPCALGNGQNGCGLPFAGNSAVGHWKGNGDDGSKEWSGIRLLEPTVPGDCYEISFWIQNKKDRAGQEFVTNHWGVFFSETRLPLFNPNLFNLDMFANQWVASERVIDGSDWILIELNFQADAIYEFLFVGFMGNVSSATQRIHNSDSNLGCYVWIDELYVRHVDVDVPEDSPICIGDSTTVRFVSDYPIRWSDGTNTDTTRAFRVSPLQTTTYYVTATGSTGCTKVDSVTIEVQFPNNNIVDGNYCTFSEPFLLEPENPAGRWLGPGIQDESSSLFDPSLAGPGVHTVYYLAPTGCAESAGYTVTVADVTAPELSASNLSGCTPLTVSLAETGNGSPAAEYRWLVGDTTFLTTVPEAEYTFRQGGDYAISVDAVYSTTCTVSVTLPASIKVNQSPVADFQLTPEMLTNLNGQTTFRDQSSGDIVAWNWEVDGRQLSGRSEVDFAFNEAGNFDVLLNVEDRFGCSDSLRRTIPVLSEAKMYVPNAFSPNADGINDQFELGIAGQVGAFSLEIFDRWGGSVFYSDDPEVRWEGLGKNGKPVETGTYLYNLSYRAEDTTGAVNSDEKVVYGTILLLR